MNNNFWPQIFSVQEVTRFTSTLSKLILIDLQIFNSFKSSTIILKGLKRPVYYYTFRVLLSTTISHIKVRIFKFFDKYFTSTSKQVENFLFPKHVTTFSSWIHPGARPTMKRLCKQRWVHHHSINPERKFFKKFLQN